MCPTLFSNNVGKNNSVRKIPSADSLTNIREKCYTSAQKYRQAKNEKYLQLIHGLASLYSFIANEEAQLEIAAYLATARDTKFFADGFRLAKKRYGINLTVELAQYCFKYENPKDYNPYGKCCRNIIGLVKDPVTASDEIVKYLTHDLIVKK